MSSCLIVYFSQGGTTKKIADAIAKGIGAGTDQVYLHNLKDGPPPDVRNYDVLGIGSPAYQYRSPLIVTDYLNSLPELQGKPVFTFILYGTYLGDAGNQIRRALERKGGRETGYVRYHGASTFLGYLKHGYFFSPDHPTSGDVAEAESFGREILARLAGKQYRRPSYDVAPAFIYRLERFFMSPLLIKEFYSRLFRVRRKKCNSCGICMKLCPTSNITQDSAGCPVWGRNCLLCFTCEMKCPSDAIHSTITWFIFWPFLIYNTRAAAADPAIETSRVIHKNGRTTASHS